MCSIYTALCLSRSHLVLVVSLARTCTRIHIKIDSNKKPIRNALHVAIVDVCFFSLHNIICMYDVCIYVYMHVYGIHSALQPVYACVHKAQAGKQQSTLSRKANAHSPISSDLIQSVNQSLLSLDVHKQYGVQLPYLGAD